MADVLTPPLLAAAAVLAVAGIAKLREPAGAVRALGSLGFAAAAGLVRVFAVGELLLACWVLVHPARVATAALAALYASFALITLVLARRRAACGCFGGDGPPASAAQSLLSGALSIVALTASLSATGAHGLGWMLDRSLMSGIVLVLGTAGSAYGAVVAYSEIPQAWGAWSRG